MNRIHVLAYFLSVWHTFIMKNDSELRIIIRTRLRKFVNHALAYHRHVVISKVPCDPICCIETMHGGACLC